MEFCGLFDQTGMHEILFTYRQMDWVKTGMLGILFNYRQVDQSSMYGILSTYRQMDRLKPVCLEFCAWQTCRWIDQRFLTMWLLTTTHHSYVHHHWPHGMHIGLHNFWLCLSSNEKHICQNTDLTCVLEMETLFTNNDTIGIPQASTLTDKLFFFWICFCVVYISDWTSVCA